MNTEHPDHYSVTDLIATKLDHRHNKQMTVLREHLWERLDLLCSSDYRVAAVEAPAGYGKTTMLSQWRERLAQQAIDSGWISIDPADDDPARFLAYLSAALRKIIPNFDFKSATAFLSSNPVGVDPLLAELTKSLSDANNKFILFLDDYHLITSRDVHDIVTRLIREATPNLAFVVAGRYRSPLPFTQLNVNNQLVKISAQDLSFSTEEVRTFFREIKGIGIDDAQIDTLRELSEGWIAGLQLAALALKNVVNAKQFIEDFSGSDRDITDYLGEMVLDHQPPEIRDFLLKTSVLGRLNASLCQHVTGHQHSQALLERIEAENLFLLPLDRDRNWYRYHPLFSDFLQSRLRVEKGDNVNALLRNASQWSRANDYETEAVDYAFRAQDIDLAASIIAEKAPDLARIRGEMRTVLEWVKRLPSDVLEQLPDVQIANAWSLTFCRRWDEMEDQLALLETYADKLKKDGSNTSAPLINKIRASVEMNRAIAMTVRDRFQISRKLCAGWLEDWPDGDTIDTAAVATALVYSTINTFEFEFGRSKYVEAKRACERAGNYYAIAWDFASLGMIALRQGHLQEATETYREGLNYIEEKCGESRSFMSSLLSIFMAEALYEENRISEADEFLSEARPFMNNHGTVEIAYAGYGTQARLQALAGKIDTAFETLREGERLGYRSKLLRLSATMIAEQIMLNLRMGNTSAAKALADRKGFLSSDPRELNNYGEQSHDIKHLVKVRLFMADMPQRSVSMINDLITRAKKLDRKRHLIELYILKSKALWMLGKKLEAQRQLDVALRLSASEGFIRAFVDEGIEVYQILNEILSQRQTAETLESLGLSFEYIERLKNAMDQPNEITLSNQKSSEPSSPNEDTAPPNVIEKLTRRESQLLQLIEAGHSNGELAGQLFISEQTVKWHLHNLYTKLGARSRTSAISRARKLELI
jgi:ATP/maltotriose-dependent transcriptional regulator MalT